MSGATATPPSGAATELAVPRRRLRAKSRTSLLAHGEPLVWLTGGALMVGLVMIGGLLVLILCQGVGTFWPQPLVEVQLLDGSRYLGEVIREEEYRPGNDAFSEVPAGKRAAAHAAVQANGGVSRRRLLRTDNYDLTQAHHLWVSDFAIAAESTPEWALLIERDGTQGRFIGFPRAFLIDGKEVATDPSGVWAAFNEQHAESRQRIAQAEKINKDQIGALNRQVKDAELAAKRVELKYGKNSAEAVVAEDAFQQVKAAEAEQSKPLVEAMNALHLENRRYELELTALSGKKEDTKKVVVGDIVRAYPANRLGFFQKLGVYGSRWWEFVSDKPRNANTEGGVWPAIWGTAVMTIFMSLAVMPFGVLAALYLREYAKAGFIVSAVRIAVNNLAGVPSIVFGVFGLGFFCYFLGAGIDDVFFQADKEVYGSVFGTGGLLWASLTLAILTLPVVIVATEEALAAVPSSMREGSYACGASKWQTIRRIVLPRAMPGILTGMILAMARGAGEVAPLMLVGAKEVAATLPVDGVFPYLHLERGFLHLGFQIYNAGFKSQDSESAKPMVFTITLLLIVLIASLNLAAMWLRARLRKRYMGSQF
jgi:phosphate transport system permease protein